MLSKSNASDISCLNQTAISLLLLAMILIEEPFDQEIIQIIGLACILSLIIKEVDSQWDTNLKAENRPDTKKPASVVSTDPPSEMVDKAPSKDTTDRKFTSGPNSKTDPGASTRRPVKTYDVIPNGTVHSQDIIWKPMPPKSIVPTRPQSRKESHSLSIKFIL